MPTLLYQSIDNNITLTVNYLKDYSVFHAVVVAMDQGNPINIVEKTDKKQILEHLKKGVHFKLKDGSEILIRICRFFFIMRLKVWINNDLITGFRITN